MIRRLWLGGAFAALGILGQACADNEVSLFIQQAQRPQSGSTAGCTVSEDPAGLHRNQGLLDLTVRRSFVIYPLFRSEVIEFQQRVVGHPETRGIFVDGADIALHIGSEAGPPPTGTPATYRILSTTFVPPASSAGPGYAVGLLEIIPSQVGDSIATRICQPIPNAMPDVCPVPRWPNQSEQVLAVIRPFGHTMGGVQISGAHFVFPLTFCCHCLVQFQSAADNAAIPGPDCSSTLGEATQACEIGQDDPLDCRTCALSNPTACQPLGYQLGTASCLTP